MAWVLKQNARDEEEGQRGEEVEDLMTTAARPYATATCMLQHARALGNAAAHRHAAVFLSTWSSRGSPFPIAGQLSAGDANALPATQAVSCAPVSAASALDEASCSAYRLVEHCEHCERRLAAVHIEYRWAMTFLGCAYADKVTTLEAEDVPGMQRNSKAITALIRAVTLAGCKPSKSERNAFKLCLNRATRWYQGAGILDWGFLCLIPDTISHKWMEQTRRVGEWKLWLEVVKKINLDTYKASRMLSAWLGAERIVGEPIDSKETLFIEAGVPAMASHVDEADDSEADGEEVIQDSGGREDSEDDIESAPARSLRQLSLVDMFEIQIHCRFRSVLARSKTWAILTVHPRSPARAAWWKASGPWNWW